MYIEHYLEHLQNKLRNTRKVMSATNTKVLIIASGGIFYRFRDDLFYPFKANPYFLEWLPLPQANCYLVIDLESKKPLLFIPTINDFWHSEPDPLPALVENNFLIESYPNKDKLKSILSNYRSAAVIDSNPVEKWPDSLLLNPEPLLSQIDYFRSWKSTWEIACIKRANQRAVAGHRRAEKLFREGKSEYEIHMDYLHAINSCESELPYDNIIGLNENAAVLHHMNLNKQRPTLNRSMLIDAGAGYQGYAADISRTYTTQQGVFSDLISAMDSLQKSIIDLIRPGISFVEIHVNAFNKIGKLLRDSNIIMAKPNHVEFNNLVEKFFPHGLGHLLGIQVHDRGGHLSVDESDAMQAIEKYPYLRLSRTLEKNQVLTIEPGIYFIKSLLNSLRCGPNKHYINWNIVDELIPYGGIRIEDNIVIKETGIENITRDAFLKDKNDANSGK